MDHLDVEALSAALDGESTADEAAHLAGCASCQAQVEALRPVHDAVAVPPLRVPAVVREATIVAALEAFGGLEAPDGSDTLGGPVSRDGRTTDRADAGPAGETSRPSDEMAALRARRRARPRIVAGPWIAAAAVLLLFVLAVPLLYGGAGQDDSSTDAATSDESATEESAALAAPDQGFTDVGDLGDLDPGADLRSVVDQALSARTSAAPAEGGGAASDDAQVESAEPEPTAVGDGSETTSEGDAGDAGSGFSASGGASSSAEAAEACIDPVRAELGELGALILAGTATIDGEAGLVLGFEAVGTDRPTTLVVLVTAETCRLVTFQSYATG